MGGRMMKDWIKKPLTVTKEIENRYDAVEELLQNTMLRNSIRQTLGDIADIERIISRLSVEIGNARDIVNLKNSLQIKMNIKKVLEAQPEVRKKLAPLFDSADDCSKVVVRQNDRGHFFRTSGSPFSHGDSDICRFERGHVIDAISGHGNKFARSL
jgi:DNA mismatch repair protein MutS